MPSHKQQNDLYLLPRQTIQYHSNPICALTKNAGEAEVEQFCEDLQDLLELTPKKDVLFIIGDWNAKVGSQETPGVTGKFGLGVQNEAGQRLTEFCQENTLVIANTLSNNTGEDSTCGYHQMINTEIRLIIYSLQPKMEKLYKVSKNKTGADCGSDHELLIARFRPKLKKAGKMTRSFRYDLNQIPNDYTVEVINRFKGLNLIDRVPGELWTEIHDIVDEMGVKTMPKKKKCKKAKWLSEAK